MTGTAKLLDLGGGDGNVILDLSRVETGRARVDFGYQALECLLPGRFHQTKLLAKSLFCQNVR